MTTIQLYKSRSWCHYTIFNCSYFIMRLPTRPETWRRYGVEMDQARSFQIYVFLLCRRARRYLQDPSAHTTDIFPHCSLALLNSCFQPPCFTSRADWILALTADEVPAVVKAAIAFLGSSVSSPIHRFVIHNVEQNSLPCTENIPHATQPPTPSAPYP